MWWCTSMRWGPVGAGVVHPDAANTPSAALPVTRRRRPMSGRPVDADRGAQDAHTEPILPRLASMAVPVLSASQARIGLRGHVFKLGSRKAVAVCPRASPEVPKYAGSHWRFTSGSRVAGAAPAPSRVRWRCLSGSPDVAPLIEAASVFRQAQPPPGRSTRAAPAQRSAPLPPRPPCLGPTSARQRTADSLSRSCS